MANMTYAQAVRKVIQEEMRRDDKVFVMGDDRAISLDSRTTAVGSVSKEQVLGQVMFRVWPLKEFGSIK